MKRRLHLWLGICLVAFLILPIHSTGAGNLTLILPDGTGAGIAAQPFDAFSLDSSGNLTVVLPTYPDIANPQVIWTISNANGCVINPDGVSITAESNRDFSFQISAASAETTLPVALVYPSGADLQGGTGSAATFSWKNTQAGNFIAVFTTGQPTGPQSQKVVDIVVVPADGVASFVRNFYVKILNQFPTSTDAEFVAWVTNLKNKSKTAADIAKDFFFTKSQGQSLSDFDFVRLVCELLLQRTARTEDINSTVTWLTTLGTNGRQIFLDAFISSSEFEGICKTLGILAYASTTPTQYTVATSVSPAGAGAVTGTGTYDSGATVTVTATPSSSTYTFSSWTEGAGVLTSSNPYIFTITGNRSLVANFTSSSTPPPTGGTTWVWYPNPSPMVIMNKGEVMTYIVDVPPPDGNKRLIGPVVTGLTNTTKGSVTWQYPNGTFATGGDSAVEGNGLLIAAIPVRPIGSDLYVPSGKHVFKIYCDSNGSYFKVRIDTY